MVDKQLVAEDEDHVKLRITTPWSQLKMIANFDFRHQFEFDCNQEASLVRGARPHIDFNSSSIYFD